MVERTQSPFEQELLQSIAQERTRIQELLEHPQDIEIINVQTYWAQQNKREEWVPNIEGQFAIQAVVALIEQLVQNAETQEQALRLPPIVISGGHEASFGGTTLSAIYSTALHQALQQSSIINQTIVVDTKLSQQLDHNSIHILAEHALKKKVGRRLLAEDTRGTLTFLDQIRETIGFKKALSIGRLGHLKRIQTLADRNGVPTEQLSIEGIIAYFHPEFLSWLVENPEAAETRERILESERNFDTVEQRNRQILRIDRQGRGMEAIARILGRAKQLFTHRERQ